MRIVIDFQGAQTGSRFRGIGHYSTELVKAMIAEGAGHDFVLALNGAFPESIEPIRSAFSGILSQKNIQVYYIPQGTDKFDKDAENAREMAQVIREYFLRALEPDVILITSVFEGLGEPAVISVKEYVKDVPTAAIFYDFTPLIIPDEYFQKSSIHRFWYRKQIEQLKNCDAIFTISESSRRELHHYLDFDEGNSFNIFGGCGKNYKPRTYSDAEISAKMRKFGVDRPFILYVGGLEPNKNLQRLIESLSFLPEKLKEEYEFVIVGKRKAGEKEKILSFATDSASKKMINVVGYVSQDDLIDLYNLCTLFAFPSLREGLGLPPAEAMACGAPTIVSNRTSLPEVVENPEAEFDPEDPAAIGAKITQVLSDPSFRDDLVSHGLDRAKALTWENSAKVLLGTLERQVKPYAPYDESRRSVVLRTSRFVKKNLRILALKLDHNGDFLLAVPALAKLRARYPDARLDVVVGSWNKEAALSLGMFDNIYTLDYFKSKSSVRPKLVEEEMDALRTQLPFYDFAVDLRRQPETRALFVQLPASKYFGYACGDDGIDRLLTDPMPRYEEPFAVRCEHDASSTSEQILQLIDRLPFGASDYSTAFPEMSPRLPVQAGSIAIFPRVGTDAREWGEERFAKLIDSLAAHEKVSQINLYGGRLEELNSVPFQPNAKIAMHAGLRFPDLLTSLSANQLCLGNNSFGVHLGGYAGCQTIGIYSGHEVPQQWGPPFGDSYAITVDAPCSPCHLPDKPSCPYNVFCLTDITVQTVLRVVLSAIEGAGVREDYAKIVRANPASAVQPLLYEVKSRKNLGQLDSLSDAQKTELAAAVSVNFPERPSPKRSVYLDVTGLASDVLGGPSLTQMKLDDLRSLASALRNGGDRQHNLILIAAGKHDHEFYTVDDGELFELDRVLALPERRNRVVRPLAGDLYFAPDFYLDRNTALWNLLATWRQNGVDVIMQAPDMAVDGRHSDDVDDQEKSYSAYLYKLAHFDGIAVAAGQKSKIEDQLAPLMPLRLRSLGVFECGVDQAGRVDEDFVALLLADAIDGRVAQ